MVTVLLASWLPSHWHSLQRKQELATKVSIASGVGPDSGRGDNHCHCQLASKNPTPREAQNKSGAGPSAAHLPRHAYNNHQIPLLKRTQGL